VPKLQQDVHGRKQMEASNRLKFMIVTPFRFLLLSANGRCHLTNSNSPGSKVLSNHGCNGP
jgi:hypothetical protein